MSSCVHRVRAAKDRQQRLAENEQPLLSGVSCVDCEGSCHLRPSGCHSGAGIRAHVTPCVFQVVGSDEATAGGIGGEKRYLFRRPSFVRAFGPTMVKLHR